jgi:excisionase family DNA binding protein
MVIEPKDFADFEEVQLLTLEEVCELTRLSEATIYAMVKAYDFPRFIKLRGSPRFRYRDVQEWMYQKFDA